MLCVGAASAVRIRAAATRASVPHATADHDDVELPGDFIGRGIYATRDATDYRVVSRGTRLAQCSKIPVISLRAYAELFADARCDCTRVVVGRLPIACAG